MRSYYEHLLTTAAPAEQAIAPKPTFRSSAIFPVIQKSGISTRILFMGYWILKRHIKEIAAVLSLRNSAGKLLTRSSFLIQEAKSYRFEVGDLLNQVGLNQLTDFNGSLEIEFFSTQNLFFPYPAVVVNYYGPNFSTVVHTAQRIYNDFDDMTKNSQTEVPESGFNIYADEEREPFIGLINGSSPVNNSRIYMLFINQDQQILEYEINLGQLAPYETKWIYPSHSVDLRQFLKGQPGIGKIRFNVNWIFPRLIVGNIHHKIPAMTITHTYYDCSEAKNDSDYWRPAEPGWHAATLMLPAAVKDPLFTNIYFYPIYSPSKFSIDAEIYDMAGKLLGSALDAAIITSPQLHFYKIPIKSICEKLAIDTKEDYAVRLIAKPHPDHKLPARLKVGLDIGLGQENFSFTPCNICTNLQPFNPSLENKPTSFRWSPVLADQPSASVWIMNSSPAVNYLRDAEITLTFFHESDDKTLTRTIHLPPNGFKVLRIHEDEELSAFFNGCIGWMTAVTTNPYTTTYYFAENPSGVVGGDHGF